MIALLPHIVLRANLPLAVERDHAFAPDLGDERERRTLEDVRLEDVDRLCCAGYVVVRLLPRAGDRYSAVLVPRARGGYRVAATSYELDLLVCDPRKRITCIAPHGLGRWAIAWIEAS